MGIKITACIITYNEEEKIALALKSLDFVDEILIVDSLSTDNTLNIAKKFGAKTIKQKFLGHVKQKQLAVDKAKYDWILSIDADELISPELKKSLLNLKKLKKIEHNAYYCNRRNFFNNKWIKYGRWYPDKRIRFFNRNFAAWAGTNPHDYVKAKENASFLKGDILHYTFKNISENANTNNNFSSIGAQELYIKRHPFHYYQILIRPIFKFIYLYFFRLGFLDGFYGLTIAVGAAYANFMKYAKLHELYYLEKTSIK